MHSTYQPLAALEVLLLVLLAADVEGIERRVLQLDVLIREQLEDYNAVIDDRELWDDAHSEDSDDGNFNRLEVVEDSATLITDNPACAGAACIAHGPMPASWTGAGARRVPAGRVRRRVRARGVGTGRVLPKVC